MDIETLDLSSLAEHGDRVKLDDGRTVRLVVESDPDMSILDEQGEDVWCGRLEWDSRYENAYGYRTRPSGFTGRANVILRDRDARLWWEAPADVVIGSDVYRSLRQSILDLVEYGYVQVGLILECEHGGQLDAAWIGGCDSLYPGLVGELAAELDWNAS